MKRSFLRLENVKSDNQVVPSKSNTDLESGTIPPVSSRIAYTSKMEAFIQEQEQRLAALSQVNDSLEKDFVGDVAESLGYFIGWMLAVHMENLLIACVTKTFCPRVKPAADWLLSLRSLKRLVKASRRLHYDLKLNVALREMKQLRAYQTAIPQATTTQVKDSAATKNDRQSTTRVGEV